jgi:hypothetical protein
MSKNWQRQARPRYGDDFDRSQPAPPAPVPVRQPGRFTDQMPENERRQHNMLVAACAKRDLFFSDIGGGCFRFKVRGDKNGPLLFEASSFDEAIQWVDSIPISRRHDGSGTTSCR